MNEYTIRYKYGSYVGEKVVRSDNEKQAIAKMWRQLDPYMSLTAAYQSAKVIKVRNY